MTLVPAAAYPVMPVAPVAAAGGVAGLGATPATSTADETSKGEESKERGDSHLRSAKEVIGYYARARDGDIGHVEDILVKGRDWSIGYFIIDTKNWWPGKMVLIRPDWIDSISWGQRLVHLSRSREEVKMAPEYDQSQPIDSRSG